MCQARLADFQKENVPEAECPGTHLLDISTDTTLVS